MKTSLMGRYLANQFGFILPCLAVGAYLTLALAKQRLHRTYDSSQA